VKTRELALGTEPRMVTASEEREREGGREIDTDTQTRRHMGGAESACEPVREVGGGWE
jgi:hypothetical protein